MNSSNVVNSITFGKKILFIPTLEEMGIPSQASGLGIAKMIDKYDDTDIRYGGGVWINRGIIGYVLIGLGSIGIIMSFISFYAYFMVKKEQYEYMREHEKKEFDSRAKSNLIYSPLISISLVAIGIYMINLSN